MSDEFEPFESPLLLIGAAKENLVKLKSACDSFVKNAGYKIMLQQDMKTGDAIIKAHMATAFPGQIRVIASTIINDLRHALDQAVCDGALILGASNSKNIYFPFAKDLADFNVVLKDKCRKVRPDLVDFIKNFNPYFGGDNLLWALNKLAGINKHQRIVSIAVNPNSIIEIQRAFWGRNIKTLVINKWNDRKNELEVIRVNSVGDMEVNFSFRLDLEIVMGKADIVSGQPAIAILNTFVSKAESIVLGIKAESERLLRI